MYYVIYVSDAETYVEEMSEETLKSRLAENYYGERKFKTTFGGSYSTFDCADDLLIIKGNIVRPKPVQVVTEYEV